MYKYYKLDNSNKLFNIVNTFLENEIYIYYPVRKNGINNVKQYINININIVETSNLIYFIFKNYDKLIEIVNKIKAIYINNMVLKNRNIVNTLANEREKYIENKEDYTKEDEFLLLEKRLYWAKHNMYEMESLLYSPIFIEITPFELGDKMISRLISR